ncbi:Signal recognition particle receptor FtsY [Buchnera aphidicola (Neophyllaphis podocarpi)]|uniref:signal recognition particle-docking protein FtsY n=1 Tax=Buchnera aphidicola TaxID=9 RepID=UPI0034638930
MPKNNKKSFFSFFNFKKNALKSDKKISKKNILNSTSSKNNSNNKLDKNILSTKNNLLNSDKLNINPNILINKENNINILTKKKLVKDIKNNNIKKKKNVNNTVLFKLNNNLIISNFKKPNKFLTKLKEKLNKTREQFSNGLINLLFKKKLDDSLFEKIEDELLLFDVGYTTSSFIIKKLKKNINIKHYNNKKYIYSLLKKEMFDILFKSEQRINFNRHKPFVILVVGVNGSGKTTTIAKLTHKFKKEGKSVMLAAGDTFRPAAIEQLQIWAVRNSVHMVSQKIGSDSASVIFDAICSAKSKKIDVLIADTAGRLQTNLNLMEELKKIVRVIKKIDLKAPHEILLVIDACNGQNSISQIQLFNKFLNITGLAITKLDGTAKGGILFCAANKFNLPIRYISIGEKISDLQDFNTSNFINSLFL